MRCRRRTGVAAIAAWAAVALTACGTGASAGDTRQVHAAVHTLLEQCEAAKTTEILPILTPAAKRAFVTGEDALTGCENVLRLVPDGEDAPLREVFAEAHVTNVVVTGDIGLAEIRTIDDWTSTVEAEDTGSDWLVTNGDLP